MTAAMAAAARAERCKRRERKSGCTVELGFQLLPALQPSCSVLHTSKLLAGPQQSPVKHLVTPLLKQPLPLPPAAARLPSPLTLGRHAGLQLLLRLSAAPPLHQMRAAAAAGRLPARVALDKHMVAHSCRTAALARTKCNVHMCMCVQADMLVRHNATLTWQHTCAHLAVGACQLRLQGSQLCVAGS